MSMHAQRGNSQPRVGRHSKHNRLASYEAVQTPEGGIPLSKDPGGSFLQWEQLCLVAGHTPLDRDPTPCRSNTLPQKVVEYSD